MAKRILVVDDEHSIREGLSKLLEAECHEVVLAQSGREAIATYGAMRIDLLILDLNVSARKGGADLDWLVEINPLLPIIIITGRSNQRVLAESAGADALMEKPLDLPLLLRTIHDLMNEPLESRSRRARSRASVLRGVPCDSELSCEMPLKRKLTSSSLRSPTVSC